MDTTKGATPPPDVRQRDRENLRRLASHYIAQARTLADLAEQLIDETDPTDKEPGT